MANLQALSIVASVLGCVGYLPELFRITCKPDAQPSSHALWLVWVTAAVLNLTYASLSNAPAPILFNYGAHSCMCIACCAMNVRLACQGAAILAQGVRWRSARPPAAPPVSSVL